MNSVRRVTVRVPATTANIGPGFDCIGFALDIWNETTVERAPFGFQIEGEGEASLPRDSRNLVITGLMSAFRAAGVKPDEFAYRCRNSVPVASGLGSSSAAIVAGILAGASFLDRRFEMRELLDLAASIEGHPDNVAPALLGGCQIGVKHGAHWYTDPVSLPPELKAVIFVPDQSSKGSTMETRLALPAEVSRSDAVYNIGRAALLVNALANRNFDALKVATEDRLHQPARSSLFPYLNHVIKAALAAGAHGGFLSGAGPSVIALASAREMTVAYEMTEAARLFGVAGKTRVVMPTIKGAHVVKA
ncbi:MAG: homoserine kinase [SAR202 cluster bacterium]|nr:homoserine kinase [SAR202 cluster bacterium]